MTTKSSDKPTRIGCSCKCLQIMSLIWVIGILYFCCLHIEEIAELSRKECVTSADCKRLFPKNNRKHHCEVNIYKCVQSCSPTRHETLILRKVPQPFRNWLFETENVWKLLKDAIQYLMAVCAGTIGILGYTLSLFKKARMTLSAYKIVIAFLLIVPFIGDVIEFVLPESVIIIAKEWWPWNKNQDATFHTESDKESDDDDKQNDNIEVIKSWDEDFVCVWINFVFSQEFCNKLNIVQIFKENGINGAMLMELNDKLLKELNIGNTVQRKRIMFEIKKLKNSDNLHESLISKLKNDGQKNEDYQQKNEGNHTVDTENITSE